jgi:hypothetical protein
VVILLRRAVTTLKLKAAGMKVQFLTRNLGLLRGFVDLHWWRRGLLFTGVLELSTK